MVTRIAWFDAFMGEIFNFINHFVSKISNLAKEYYLPIWILYIIMLITVFIIWKRKADEGEAQHHSETEMNGIRLLQPKPYEVLLNRIAGWDDNRLIDIREYIRNTAYLKDAIEDFRKDIRAGTIRENAVLVPFEQAYDEIEANTRNMRLYNLYTMGIPGHDALDIFYFALMR